MFGVDNIKLIIAEKPSVAQTIAKVLGVADRKDGYFSNSEYYISWCIGHLVSAVYPQVYDEKYKSWSLSDLPIIPERWQYEVAGDKKKQFGVLKKLMNQKDVDELICATDSGREGELIFRLVYNQAKCKKPFKRLWTSSLEDKAILEGLENLKNGTDFDNLYRSADSRDKADWLVGMNLSRLLSLIYKGKLAVGRVKTPTLAMIADRDTEIRLFKKETLYTADLSLNGLTLTSEKFKSKADAETLTQGATGKSIAITSVVSEQKTVKPPKLYDLTTLQRECNRLFHYTAQQTLDIAQSLYESKLITYPRTDSQYLTEDMSDTTLTVIDTIQGLSLFAEELKLQHEPNLAPLLDNSKVSDHYAIIPTMQIGKIELSTLPQEQQQVLTLVAGKLLCAVSAPHVYESTKITGELEGTAFTTTGKTIVDAGFKALEQIVYKKKEREQGEILPSVAEGASLPVFSASVGTHETTPPKPYTEDTLLSAMERSGQLEAVHDTDFVGGATKKAGLGTPATRAATIESLVKDGYISRVKNNVTATKTGLNLVSVVPEEIRSPKLTAEWETKLQQVEQGKYSPDTFLAEIESLIGEQIQRYESIKDTVDTSLFAAEKEVLGTCPRCGGSVVFGVKHKNYYCENRDCDFSLWENNKLFASLGKKITKKIVQDFLKDGESYVEGFVSSKTGKTFAATVVLKDTVKYVNFDLKFK